MQEKLNNVLKHIQSKNKTNEFFEYLLMKYDISERKMEGLRYFLLNMKKHNNNIIKIYLIN